MNVLLIDELRSTLGSTWMQDAATRPTSLQEDTDLVRVDYRLELQNTVDNLMTNHVNPRP